MPFSKLFPTKRLLSPEIGLRINVLWGLKLLTIGDLQLFSKTFYKIDAVAPQFKKPKLMRLTATYFKDQMQYGDDLKMLVVQDTILEAQDLPKPDDQVITKFRHVWTPQVGPIHFHEENGL